MKWEKEILLTEEGNIEAIMPLIVSASRSTDIPAFYSEWLIKALKRGYCRWKNPFNGKFQYVSFKKMKHIVFWSKNPAPIIPYIKYLDESNYSYYFQFTLNDYPSNIEPNLPPLSERIATFKLLSQLIGRERVIWRCDPLLLTEQNNIEGLLDKIYSLGNNLYKYTNKLVFSYADINEYRNVHASLIRKNIMHVDFDVEKMLIIARSMKRFNQEWKIEIATCCEKINLDQFGIAHNKCIDDGLILQLTKDKELISFLSKYRNDPCHGDLFSTVSLNNALKDKGQRKECGCIVSKDIGQYNTCSHLCAYCYANPPNGNIKAME